VDYWNPAKMAVWLDAFLHPFPRRCELYILTPSRRRYVIPKCFRSRTTNDTGSEHEMATRRVVVITFSVDAHR